MADANEGTAAEKDARREKHKKRMNKILLKAWNLDDSSPFQTSSHTANNAAAAGSSAWAAAANEKDIPKDLTFVGENLDKGRYEHGRSGWELYAKDMGCVYNAHIGR